MMAVRRKSTVARRVAPTVSSSGGSCPMNKSWCVVCGLVFLVFGVALFKGIWSLEMVVALLLILCGLKHLFFGLRG